MKCPYCGYEESKVIDSRSSDDGERIRRRRECEKCIKRFTTYEFVEQTPIIVIKSDQSRQPFDRNKLLNGLMRACYKRPINYDTLNNLVSEIEQNLINSYANEITTKELGGMALEKLKDIDEVAYVRFASVYRRFDDIETFINEINSLLEIKHDKD